MKGGQGIKGRNRGEVVRRERRRGRKEWMRRVDVRKELIGKKTRKQIKLEVMEKKFCQQSCTLKYLTDLIKIILYKMCKIFKNITEVKYPCISTATSVNIYVWFLRTLYASSALHFSSLSSWTSFLISSRFISNNIPASFAAVS